MSAGIAANAIGRRRFMAGLLGGAAAFAGQISSRRRPNILFICTDDQAYWTLHCAGNANAMTPHVDQLRAQGAYFSNAFVAAPVCSPSRATTLSGRFGTEVGITDVLGDKDPGLPADTVIWPRVLSDAGYFTGLIGKWHLGAGDQHYPTRFGFRYFAGFRTGAGTSIDPDVECDGKVQRVPGFTAEILTDLAIRFMRERGQEPFSLNVHYWEPHMNQRQHTPDGDRTWLPVPDEIWQHFRTLSPAIPNPDFPHLDVPRVKRMTVEYLASVASVDRSVGRLLASLDELKLAENTVVVYTGDNGFNIGHNGIWHKGNGWWILTTNRDGNRPNLYDNSIHVPCIMRWPGVIRPGTVIPETISTVDWYPTILSMTGVPRPPQSTLRGMDFTPLLRRGKVTWDNDLYAEYSTRKYGNADLRMYRTPHWKLIRDFHNTGKDELYHLAKDPAETTNLIESPGKEIHNIRATLDTKLLATMHQIGDPLAGVSK
jgi:uncharacterized sulfatase